VVEFGVWGIHNCCIIPEIGGIRLGAVRFMKAMVAHLGLMALIIDPVKLYYLFDRAI
jgi:hypothetical protein